VSGLDEQFLAWLRVYVPSDAVRRQADSAGLDLEALRSAEPLTYAAINAVALVRTDARLLPQVSAAVSRLGPYRLFNVPLRVQQTDTELRIFPPLPRDKLAALDDALGALGDVRAGRIFYRIVTDAAGERRELAWPVAPEAWQAGAALVGPFAAEADADAWGREHVDPRSGFVFDTLPYARAWFCDVFRGEL
jgi:hypothetical protein